MKVFVFTGSRRVNSATEETAIRFCNEAATSLSNESFEIIQHKAGSMEILPCKGCLLCFQHGYCPLDCKDDLLEVKKKLLQSDVVVIGSPVYAAAISSDTKRLIERLSYWLHLMPLAGKRGIPIVSADNNSVLEVSSYLKRIMQSWGLFIPVSLTHVANPTDQRAKQEPGRIEYIAKQAEVFSLDWQSNSSPYSAFHERLFSQLRNLFNNNSALTTSSEYSYWKELGMESMPTYADYLNRLTKLPTPLTLDKGGSIRPPIP